MNTAPDDPASAPPTDVGPDAARCAVGRAYDQAVAAGGLAELALDRWAGRGGWAVLSANARSDAGRRALNHIDVLLADVGRVRQQLADALAGYPVVEQPLAGPAAVMLVADLVVFAPDDNGHPHVLLVRRDPCTPEDSGTGEWVVPGGGMEPGETFEQAALRETSAETGVAVRVGAAHLVGVFDAAPSDPIRTRVISAAYVVTLTRPFPAYAAAAGSDTAAVAWRPVDNHGRVPGVVLASVHTEMVQAAWRSTDSPDPNDLTAARQLAEARQEIAVTDSLFPVPHWSELTDQERTEATLEARNYRRAFIGVTRRTTVPQWR